MFEWLTRRWTPALTPAPREIGVAPPRTRGTERAIEGTFRPLFTYLDTRFADTLVLTFAQIEDVMGAALPPQARVEAGWWTDPRNGDAPHHSDSWTLAHRTAVPNLNAKIVAFARAF